MSIQPTTSNKARSPWTLEEDAQVVAAVSEYNREFPDHAIVGFLSTNGGSRFSTIKERLPSLNKSSKQIRERWVTKLSPSIKSSGVLKEDAERVMDLCRQHPGNWREVSRKSLEIFGGKGYSDNAVKNFFHSEARKRSFRGDRKECIKDNGFVIVKRKSPSVDILDLEPIAKKPKSDDSPVLKHTQPIDSGERSSFELPESLVINGRGLSVSSFQGERDINSEDRRESGVEKPWVSLTHEEVLKLIDQSF